jgi:hypothetical protein
MRPSLALAGPDVVVSVVGPDLNKYGTRDLGTPGSPRLVTAYAATTTACNIGDALASWVDFNNQHPVIGQQMYRLHGGRFEQIGLSWLKHSFCAADEPSCTFLQQGSQYQPDSGDCYTLGFFANDTYSAFLNSQQFTLGPRSEVNAANGYFPYPFTLGWGQTGDCLNKRMQIANADLGPAGFPGARFFHEVHYVSADEAAGEGGVRANNASYREVLVGSLTSGPGTGGCDPAVQGHNLAFTGGTVYFKPAIHAWKTIDPDVTLVEVDVPGDGRIVVACKVVALGAGEWSYEYAVYNHNSHRCIGAVVLPKSSDPAAVISQLGFRAPAYHSGEPYSAAAWTSHVETGSLSWSTESFADNPNANAIRWGTLYNFRFHAARAPALGTLTLGLFRPAGPDEPASVRIAGIPVPVDVCRADFDGSGGVTVQDIFDFLGAYFTAQPSADINADGHIAVQDVFDFLAAWFRGC